MGRRRGARGAISLSSESLLKEKPFGIIGDRSSRAATGGPAILMRKRPLPLGKWAFSVIRPDVGKAFSLRVFLWLPITLLLTGSDVLVSSLWQQNLFATCSYDAEGKSSAGSVHLPHAGSIWIVGNQNVTGFHFHRWDHRLFDAKWVKFKAASPKSWATYNFQQRTIAVFLSPSCNPTERTAVNRPSFRSEYINRRWWKWKRKNLGASIEITFCNAIQRVICIHVDTIGNSPLSLPTGFFPDLLQTPAECQCILLPLRTPRLILPTTLPLVASGRKRNRADDEAVVHNTATDQ